MMIGRGRLIGAEQRWGVWRREREREREREKGVVKTGEVNEGINERRSDNENNRKKRKENGGDCSWANVCFCIFLILKPFQQTKLEQKQDCMKLREGHTPTFFSFPRLLIAKKGRSRNYSTCLDGKTCFGFKDLFVGPLFLLRQKMERDYSGHKREEGVGSISWDLQTTLK